MDSKSARMRSVASYRILLPKGHLVSPSAGNLSKGWLHGGFMWRLKDNSIRDTDSFLL